MAFTDCEFVFPQNFYYNIYLGMRFIYTNISIFYGKADKITT